MWVARLYGQVFRGSSPEAVIRKVERYERTCNHRLLSIVPQREM